VRQQLQAPDSLHGAVVERVQPGSPADNAGLQQGDVILEVNRKPVHDAAEVKNALGSVPKGQDALVLVWSNGGNTFRCCIPRSLASLIAVRNWFTKFSPGRRGVRPVSHFFQITSGTAALGCPGERSSPGLSPTLKPGPDFLVSTRQAHP
jgi:membrane-associated protease RseP (regulator of RpoE activity)